MGETLSGSLGTIGKMQTEFMPLIYGKENVMNKKEYSIPEVEAVRFETEDIMTSSSSGNMFGSDIDWDGSSDSNDKGWGNW